MIIINNCVIVLIMSELAVISIGGGNPNGKAAPFLKRSLELCGKEHHTNVLVIPTAKTTKESHDKSVEDTAALYQKD